MSNIKHTNFNFSAYDDETTLLIANQYIDLTSFPLPAACSNVVVKYPNTIVLDQVLTILNKFNDNLYSIIIDNLRQLVLYLGKAINTENIIDVHSIFINIDKYGKYKAHVRQAKDIDNVDGSIIISDGKYKNIIYDKLEEKMLCLLKQRNYYTTN